MNEIARAACTGCVTSRATWWGRRGTCGRGLKRGWFAGHRFTSGADGSVACACERAKRENACIGGAAQAESIAMKTVKAAHALYLRSHPQRASCHVATSSIFIHISSPRFPLSTFLSNFSLRDIRSVKRICERTNRVLSFWNSFERVRLGLRREIQYSYCLSNQIWFLSFLFFLVFLLIWSRFRIHDFSWQEIPWIIWQEVLHSLR